MNSLLSEEQAALEQFCQKLLEKEWPLEKAVKVLGTEKAGHSPELWKVLVEAGWLGLPFSPDLGGAGGDLIDLGLVYRAAGERLVPASFYACMFAALLVDRIGSDAQKQDLLTAIIAGDRIATVAYSEPQAPENPRFFSTTAARTGDGWVLNGVKAFVPYLDLADVVLVLARTRANSDRSGWGLFAVNRDALAGASRRTTTFGSEHLFELTFDAVVLPADALLGGTAALTTTLGDFEDVVEQATALQCMEMVGGTSSVLTRTIDYVAERKQHGRELGTFQAVQHLLANVGIQLQGGRVAALYALFQKANGRAAPRDVAVAKIALGEAYSSATITAHQLWGAMGYARETGIYLWSERAKVTDAWFGTRASHLRTLSSEMGL